MIPLILKNLALHVGANLLKNTLKCTPLISPLGPLFDCKDNTDSGSPPVDFRLKIEYR